MVLWHRSFSPRFPIESLLLNGVGLERYFMNRYPVGCIAYKLKGFGSYTILVVLDFGGNLVDVCNLWVELAKAGVRFPFLVQ
jgi:hypothetical protein